MVIKLTEHFIDSGLASSDIAVISPYAAQVRHLNSQIQIDGLEIGSIDGFQGREKELVIVSLVRSNAKGEIGFLKDTRRMNVALTRARRKLIVIGDSATICSLPFYEKMLDHFDIHQAYRSIWDQWPWTE